MAPTRSRPPGPPGERGGRPSATSAHALAAVAQRLFVERGFEAVSVEDVAAEVGVSRRTFFRYFAAKADVLWVETPAELARLRRHLAAAPAGADYRVALTGAVVAVLDHPDGDADWARHRAQLVLTVPAVQAHAARVYAQWRSVAAGFAAVGTGLPPDALFPLVAGHAALGGIQAAHEHWVAHPGASLPDALRACLALALPAPPGDDPEPG